MLSTSCHCGTVRIEIARRPRSITECRCSVCRRCGCVMQWRLKPARSAANRLAVNMRVLDDPGAPANIKVLRFDGAVSWKDLGTHTLKQPWW